MKTAWTRLRGMLSPEEELQQVPMMAALGIVAAMLVLVGLPPAGVSTMALIGLGAILAWIAPSVMVALVIVTIPIQEAVMLPYIRGDFTLTQIAIFGLVIGWGLSFWRHRIWLDSITMWYLAIAGAFCIALIAMDEPGLWAGEVYRWGIAALFFVICRSVLRNWQHIQIVLWGVVAATLATWALSLGQLTAGNGPEHMFRGGSLRVYGMFGTPNPLAAYIEFTIPPLLVLALLGIRTSFRDRIGSALWIASGATSLLGILVLALTQSRGGMVGFAMAMVVVFWALPVRLRLATFLVGIGLVALISLTPTGHSQIQRFGDVFDQSDARRSATSDLDIGRSAVWGAAVRMFVKEPWTGVGAGEFDYHYRELTPDWYQRFPLGQAHNGWLQMAAQAGVAGVFAFTGWVAATLLSLIGAARRSTEPLSRTLAIGALAVMVAFTVHSLVDYLNVLSLGLQLSAMAAIGLSLAPDPWLSTYARQRHDEAEDADASSLHTGLA
jgi:O-antigen ligase